MAAIFNLAKPMATETELTRLRTENQSLLEELHQCQTDKEFVWSLWKRLQVASPDVTQAIGMVVQREKEKAEFKDQKVLEILQMKDEKIDELQKLITSHTREVSNIQAMKLELQVDVQKLKAENEALAVECNTFKTKIEDLEANEHEMGSRQAIREMDKDILDLKQKLSHRDKDVSDLTRDKEDLSSIRDSQKDRITDLEAELRSIGDKYQTLSVEHTDVKKTVKKYENEMSILENELKEKARELESVKFELSSMWQTHNQTTDHTTQQADLIKQLRTLQKDTQQTMKNQENTFSMETAALQAQLDDQEAYIANLQGQLEELGVKTRSMPGRYGTDNKEIQTESETDPDHDFPGSQSELNMLCRPRSQSHNTSPNIRPSRSLTQCTQPRPRSPSAKKLHSRSRSEPRASSPPRTKTTETNVAVLQKKLNSAERKFEEFRELLRIKNSELEEVKGAHRRRLERLQSLQSNYRLIKKQLKLMEEENQLPKKKRRKIPRADPKSLQKEDSDKVWNELAYFRNENRNLLVERTNLQEELDVLKVNSAQDMATIYELRSCLEQEREELEYITQENQQRAPSPTPNLEQELNRSKKEIKQLRKQLKNLQEDNRAVTAEREKALADRRELKIQVNAVQQKEAEYRIKIADLNRDLSRIHRELKKKKRPKGTCRTAVGKQYQRVLNRSIYDMQTSFEDFNQDGWEEISDTEDMTASHEVTATTDSLGQEIANQAAGMSQMSDPSTHYRSIRLRPSSRQKMSVEDHVNRMAQRSVSPQRQPAAKRDTSPAHSREVHSRDIALSPIHFLGAKSPAVLSSAPRNPPVTTSVSTGTNPLLIKKGQASSNAVIRQVATLKQRIQTLQHQVTLLRTSRDNTAQKNAEQRDQISQLQSELSTTNQKLQTSRLTVQRLTSDLERLKGDKEIIEQQMEEINLESNPTQRTEQDWNNLQSRLKTASTEVSKQLAQIKNLKTQNTEQSEKIQQLQDRMNHLERDVSQKRTLMEDMKVKLRFAQENAQTDADIMTEVEGKLKNLSEANSRYKTQVESFRQRLAVISKQKHENDRKIIKLTGEIDRKNKQATELQHRTTELQTTVVAIEKTAQQQLHALANQSEAAIDVAQSKLSHTSSKLQEHDKFIKIFSHALLNSIQQARSLWMQQKQRKKDHIAPFSTELDPSLRRAQALACDILNLSQPDTDHRFNFSDDDSSDKSDLSETTEEIRKDKKWARKLEKVIQTKGEFALPLTEMFMEKVDERNKLAAKLQAS